MNKVGLFYVDCGQNDIVALAEKMVESVRNHIEGAHIVHFTNTSSRYDLNFVDERFVIDMGKKGLMESRIHAFAHYPHDEMLFLDPDVIVQCDVWSVFDSPFDVALTRRKAEVKVIGEGTKHMPYNTGVMFSRGNGFWRRVLERMAPMSMDERNWFGDQLAVAEVAESGPFNGFDVLELDGAMYNYSPAKQGEDVKDKAIVHYKGKRKAWMLS